MRAQRASVDRSQETSTSAPLIPPSLDCILEVKAGCSVEGRERLLKVAMDNVKAFLDGKPENVVNA